MINCLMGRITDVLCCVHEEEGIMFENKNYYASQSTLIKRIICCNFIDCMAEYQLDDVKDYMMVSRRCERSGCLYCRQQKFKIIKKHCNKSWPSNVLIASAEFNVDRPEDGYALRDTITKKIRRIPSLHKGLIVGVSPSGWVRAIIDPSCRAASKIVSIVESVLGNRVYAKDTDSAIEHELDDIYMGFARYTKEKITQEHDFRCDPWFRTRKSRCSIYGQTLKLLTKKQINEALKKLAEFARARNDRTSLKSIVKAGAKIIFQYVENKTGVLLSRCRKLLSACDIDKLIYPVSGSDCPFWAPT